MDDSTKKFNSLQDALNYQKSYAQRGYIQAKEAIKLLRSTIEDASNELQKEIFRLNNRPLRNEAISKELAKQLSDIRAQYLLLPEKLYENVSNLSKKDFNITVFGRTMAGKSTLMEALTHGKGDSIGNGAQRFTRDVRDYKYKGLSVTDVPGIAAFGGKTDDDVAYEAAQKSDLILFLITDQDVQPEVAEGMKHILSLGKPVICLINVKVDIDEDNISEKSMKVFRYELQERYNSEDIEGIKKQFFEYGSSYGQDWRSIIFVKAHLKAAFLSQRVGDKKYKKELYKLSGFDVVEKAIVREVTMNGCFYKLKAFTDVVSVPLSGAVETLFAQSAQNSRQGSIIVGKRKDLLQWRKEYENDAIMQIDTFVTTIVSELKREVAAFAEDNYNNPKAGRKWSSIIKKWDVEKRAESLMVQLGKACEYEVKEISRQIDFESKFIKMIDQDNSIEGQRVINGKRIWNWAASLVSGGFTIAGILVASPLIWVGIGVGVLGWLGNKFFKDYESKARNARKRLEKKLNSNIERTGSTLKKGMTDTIRKEYINNYINATADMLSDTIQSLFTLSDTQYDLANKLNQKLKELNKLTIEEAMAYCGYSEQTSNIEDVARIPGHSTIIILKNGAKLPSKVKPSIGRLLKEQVWFAFRKKQYKSILGQIIGEKCDRSEISIEKINGKSRIAHIPSIDLSDPTIFNKVRMAQQATGLLIMK